MDPVALYDTLNCASMAVIEAEGRNAPKAETAFLEASVAAMDAFPAWVAPEAAALAVILGAVGDFANGVTA